MSNPSNDSWNSEKNRILIRWESHSSIDESRIEVNIWIKLSTDEILVRQSNFLKFNSNFDQRFFTADLKDLKSNLNEKYFYLLYDFCSWIIVFVDAMAKAHQPE